MGRKVTVAGQVVGRCVVASWLQEARQGVHVGRCRCPVAPHMHVCVRAPMRKPYPKYVERQPHTIVG